MDLFTRDKRGVALTADGAQLLEQARRILGGADELSCAARTLTAMSTRHLRVGVYGNGLAELTHPVLQEFCDRYPNTTVQVRDADFAHGIEPLLNGEYDVAFLRAPVDLPVLRTVRLFSEPMNLLVWHGHRLANAESADIQEIFDDPWVTLPPSIPSAWGASWLFIEQRSDTAPSIGAFARTEGEFGAAVAYRKLSGVVPASVPRLRPHPGARAVRAEGGALSRVAVAHPAAGYRSDAAALAEVALSVAGRLLPVAEVSELGVRIIEDGPVPKALQEEPARTLPNLAQVPIAIVTAEASISSRTPKCCQSSTTCTDGRSPGGTSRFLIRADARFAAFDDVFASEGVRIVKSPPQAPWQRSHEHPADFPATQ